MLRRLSRQLCLSGWTFSKTSPTFRIEDLWTAKRGCGKMRKNAVPSDACSRWMHLDIQVGFIVLPRMRRFGPIWDRVHGRPVDMTVGAKFAGHIPSEFQRGLNMWTFARVCDGPVIFNACSFIDVLKRSITGHPPCAAFDCDELVCKPSIRDHGFKARQSWSPHLRVSDALARR